MSEIATAETTPLEAVNSAPVHDLNELVKKDAVNLRDIRKAVENPEPAPVTEEKTEPAPASAVEPPKVAAKPEPKKPSRDEQIEARFAKLSGYISERDKRIEQLEAQLSELKKPTATEPAKTDTKDPEPTPDEFDTYEQYVKAQARWEARQEIRTELQAEHARQQEAAIVHAQHRAMATFHGRIQKAKEKYTDYDDVVRQDLPLSAAMTEVIVLSDHGADLAYYLGQHPDECQRIFALPPVRQAVELGRLEAQFSVASVSGTAEKSTPVTKAAAPITPVGTAPTASTSLESLVAPTQVNLKRLNAAMRRG